MTCIVRDTPEAEPCGQESNHDLVTTYLFDEAQEFKFAFSLCEDHYQALLGRMVSTEFSAYSAS